MISLAVGIYHGELTTSSAHLPGCLASGLAVMMAILGIICIQLIYQIINQSLIKNLYNVGFGKICV